MVAAICTWHEHHERSAAEIDARLGRGETLLIAAPTLVEAYAVLTRLPPPYRLSPADAYTLVQENFTRTARIIVLDGRSYRTLLPWARDHGIRGGRIYDTVTGLCALKAGATVLLPFAERGLNIVVPGESAY